MRFRVETTCFFCEMALSIRDDWDSNRIEYEPKILAVDFHLYITLPLFNPDYQHINWVKEAWGLMPKPPSLEGKYKCEEDYDDPIPF